MLLQGKNLNAPSHTKKKILQLIATPIMSFTASIAKDVSLTILDKPVKQPLIDLANTEVT